MGPYLTVRPQRSATAGMGLVDFLLGIAFMAFLTVGLSVTHDVNSGPEFWAPRIVFGLAALSAAAAYFRWVLEHPRPLTAIILFAEVTGVLVFVVFPTLQICEWAATCDRSERA